MSTKISKNKAVELIVEELKKGSPKVAIVALNGRKWQIATRTFERYYKAAIEIHNSKAQMIEKEVNEVLVKEGVKQAKIGLKLKLDRQLELQAEIEDIQNRLKNGKTRDIYFKSGKPMPYSRELTPSEIANYRKTLLLLNAELSKMAGEYAPTKSELSGKDGKPIQVESTPKTINFNNISTEDIKTILKTHESK